MNPHRTTLCNLRLGKLYHILSSEIYRAVSNVYNLFPASHCFSVWLILWYAGLMHQWILIILPPRTTAILFARLLKCTFLMRPGCKVIYMNSGLMSFVCLTFLSDMQAHLHATSCWPYTICVWCLFAHLLVTQILGDWVVYENVSWFTFWLYILRRAATKPLVIKDNCKETAPVLSVNASK